MAETKHKMLTVREVAERTGAAIPTVNLWCRSGRLEGACQENTPYGDYWLIPEDSIKGVVVRGRGRPPKTSADTATPSRGKRALDQMRPVNGHPASKKKGGRK
jgi:hypothetical protein